MTMNDPRESKAMPEMPLPLVHPSAKRAPTMNRNPPQKAIAARGKKEEVRRIFGHMGETASETRPDNFLEKKAPKRIPMTKAICHQFFRSGKQPDSPPWSSNQQEREAKEFDAPNEA